MIYHLPAASHQIGTGFLCHALLDHTASPFLSWHESIRLSWNLSPCFFIIIAYANKRWAQLNFTHVACWSWLLHAELVVCCRVRGNWFGFNVAAGWELKLFLFTTMQIGPDQIEALYDYAKFQYECGSYFDLRPTSTTIVFWPQIAIGVWELYRGCWHHRFWIETGILRSKRLIA